MEKNCQKIERLAKSFQVYQKVFAEIEQYVVNEAHKTSISTGRRYYYRCANDYPVRTNLFQFFKFHFLAPTVDSFSFPFDYSATGKGCSLKMKEAVEQKPETNVSGEVRSSMRFTLHVNQPDTVIELLGVKVGEKNFANIMSNPENMPKLYLIEHSPNGTRRIKGPALEDNSLSDGFIFTDDNSKVLRSKHVYRIDLEFDCGTGSETIEWETFQLPDLAAQTNCIGSDCPPYTVEAHATAVPGEERWNATPLLPLEGSIIKELDLWAYPESDYEVVETIEKPKQRKRGSRL